MVSDQCCAMVRDGLLDEVSHDPKRLRVKKPPSPDQVMPAVLESGKDASKVSSSVDGDSSQGFDPDWCVVRVSDGVPKKKRSIFLHSLFPPANRPGKLRQTRADLKAYFQKIGRAAREGK